MPKGIPLDLSSGTKHCARCKETKPLDQFFKTKATKHGLSVYCRECSVKRHDAWRRDNLEHAARNMKKWRDNNKQRSKGHDLKKAYGIEHGTYETMLAAQFGQCAICGTNNSGKRSFHVDHCHTSKKIRGLLCHHCNVGLGHFQHSPTILRSAISYLAETG